MNLYEELQWRGLIKDITSEDLKEKLNEEKLTFYIGTDPTGDSLHIGHLSSFLLVKRLKEYGHNPIVLVGGATGLIGDPRPDSERTMISKETVNHNYECLKKQLERLFGCKVVNNYDWCKDINFIDFLRDYGKYFNINYMLDKDIIRRRLDEGITFTEFSYMIIQSLDFLHLFEEKGCTLQVAGQDQWGNITAGVELIRKKTGKEAYAFTMPLITKKDGSKFGKTNGKAIWLDKEKTTPYEMYQYFVNSEDEKVIEYLKCFTFLNKDEIDNIETLNNEKPELRLASKTLAYEVVKFVHGEEEAINAKKMSEELFNNNNYDNLTPLEVNKSEFKNIVDLLVITNLCPSKSEARRLVEQNGIRIDQQIINDVNYSEFSEEFILQKGKKSYTKINLR